jgi:hypothetical protein
MLLVPSPSPRTPNQPSCSFFFRCETLENNMMKNNFHNFLMKFFPFFAFVKFFLFITTSSMCLGLRKKQFDRSFLPCSALHHCRIQ